MTILRRRAVLAGAAALASPAIVRAQGTGDWPKGQLKIVVPFPPGGSTDPVARIIQAKLADQTGWNIIVDNKPGGASVVGASVAAKSPPDGQTWMITFDSHILNPAFAAHPAVQGLRPVQRHGDRPHAAGDLRPSRPSLQDVRRGDRGRQEAAWQGERRCAGREPGAGADGVHQEGKRRRPQRHPLQGRRTGQPGPAGRRH